jgi:Ca2+-binding EF-hand superfamily protein
MKTMRLALLAGFSAIAFASAAMALDAQPAAKAPSAASPTAPAPAAEPTFAANVLAFGRFVRPGITRDMFAKTLDAVASRYFTDNGALNESVLQKFDVYFASITRAQRVARILAADTEGAGTVSREQYTDFLKFFPPQSSRPDDVQKMIDEAFAGKAKGDKLTVADLIRLPAGPQQVNQDRKLGEVLLALSPDKKRLTKEQFLKIGEAAFATLDANHDGTIDKSEFDPLAKALTPVIAAPRFAPPPPPAPTPVPAIPHPTAGGATPGFTPPAGLVTTPRATPAGPTPGITATPGLVTNQGKPAAATPHGKPAPATPADKK